MYQSEVFKSADAASPLRSIISRRHCAGPLVFLPLFPLLHRRFAYAHKGCKHSLTYMICRSYAAVYLLVEKTSLSASKAHLFCAWYFIHGSNLEQISCHFMGNVQYFTHGVAPPISSRFSTVRQPAFLA